MAMNDLWVFGYGSLLWNPGFEAVEQHRAKLPDYHRALCIYSWIYRGTQDNPGLVLGLDHGGSCMGLAFRVIAEKREETLAYLRARELVTDVYLEKIVSIELDDGRTVEAVTYIVDRDNQQYAPNLSVERAASLIKGASGRGGPNPDYVLSTRDHLRQLDIHDETLEAIADLLCVTP